MEPPAEEQTPAVEEAPAVEPVPTEVAEDAAEPELEASVAQEEPSLDTEQDIETCSPEVEEARAWTSAAPADVAVVASILAAEAKADAAAEETDAPESSPVQDPAPEPSDAAEVPEPAPVPSSDSPATESEDKPGVADVKAPESTEPVMDVAEPNEASADPAGKFTHVLLSHSEPRSSKLICNQC